MVLGLFIDLAIVNHQTQCSGSRFSNQETGTTVTGVVPLFILLDGASIYTFLGLAFNLVDLLLRGRVGASPHY